MLFRSRVARTQEGLRRLEADVLLVSSEAEFRYFTGFASEFWQSPTRPFYAIIPSEGAPSVLVPEIAAHCFEGAWLAHIHTWPAPRPADDGISVLAKILHDSSRRFGRVAKPLGHETRLGMPVEDFLFLTKALEPKLTLVDAAPLIRELRSVKSAAEIAKIEAICHLASDAMHTMPDFVVPGMSETAIARRMRTEMLARGADRSPYMVVQIGRAHV